MYLIKCVRTHKCTRTHTQWLEICANRTNIYYSSIYINDCEQNTCSTAYAFIYTEINAYINSISDVNSCCIFSTLCAFVCCISSFLYAFCVQSAFHVSIEMHAPESSHNFIFTSALSYSICFFSSCSSWLFIFISSIFVFVRQRSIKCSELCFIMLHLFYHLCRQCAFIASLIRRLDYRVSAILCEWLLTFCQTINFHEQQVNAYIWKYVHQIMHILWNHFGITWSLCDFIHDLYEKLCTINYQLRFLFVSFNSDVVGACASVYINLGHYQTNCMRWRRQVMNYSDWCS